MIAIGIDPGTKTGFAVWDCAAQAFIEIMTYDFWTAYHEGLGWWARARMDNKKLYIRVEDPSGNKPVFGRGVKGRKNLKIAQNVGMNKKEARLLIEGYRRAGIVVDPVVPKQSKWTAQTFKQFSNWPHRTNEHQRDAARMVLGMKSMPDDQYQILKQNQEVA